MDKWQGVKFVDMSETILVWKKQAEELSKESNRELKIDPANNWWLAVKATLIKLDLYIPEETEN